MSMVRDLQPPRGRRVNVGGHTLAVCDDGVGDPTVVFLPGAGMMGLDLLGVHEAAAALTRSILYDRGGTGWSDPVALPRTAADVTDELRALLHLLAVRGPLVLVGHSLGGAYARHYAQRFPAEVAALILLDPAHEEIPEIMPEELRAAAAHMRANIPVEPPPGLMEFFGPLLAQKFAALPGDVRAPVLARHAALWRNGMLEASNDVEVLYPELVAGGPLPEIPVVVLGAMGVDHDMAPLSPEHVQRTVNVGKRGVNRRLAASTPRGEYRELPDASHAWMPLERPDAVVAAIRDVLQAVRGP